MFEASKFKLFSLLGTVELIFLSFNGLIKYWNLPDNHAVFETFVVYFLPLLSYNFSEKKKLFLINETSWHTSAKDRSNYKICDSGAVKLCFALLSTSCGQTFLLHNYFLPQYFALLIMLSIFVKNESLIYTREKWIQRK